MKKLMLMLGVVSALAISCTKEKPTVSFAKNISVLMADAPLKVELTVSEATESALTVPVNFAGSAVKGGDYTVSSESFAFASGSTSATIEITPKDNFDEGKEIALSIVAPDGYELGAIPSMVVSVENKEKISYSFSAEKADLLNTYTVTLELQGMKTGKDFSATSDMEIPVLFDASSTAKLGEDFTVENDATAFKVAAGTNKATLVLTATDKEVTLGSEKAIVIKVDEAKLSGRFYAGNTPSMTVTVKGIMRFSQLVGTWEFVEVPGLGDWEEFASEMGDDPALMPTHNTGFQMTFSVEEDVLKLAPGAVKGDLNNFLRPCELEYCAPIHMAVKSEKLGDYCSREPFMWTGEEIQLTYFSLSSANRAFSAEKETLGKAAAAMRFDENGNLWFIIKDYDQPPFLENWWDGDFDPDMFGFAYIMKRVQK